MIGPIRFTFLVTEEENLYLYHTKPPYQEGYVKKVLPTNLHLTPRLQTQTPNILNPSIYSTLPIEILESILLECALYRFKLHLFKETIKVLDLLPCTYVKFYLYFFPKESSKHYTIFCESLIEIYKNRVKRIIYLTSRLHNILVTPSHECPPYFLIEIILEDTNPMRPIRPWSIVEGILPKDYHLKIRLHANEYPSENQFHFAYTTGPVVGDIAWLRGEFNADCILLAATFQRPVIPITFENRKGLLRGEQILQTQPSWIYYTKLLQYIYGSDTTLYLGDTISKHTYGFYDALDPRFLK